MTFFYLSLSLTIKIILCLFSFDCREEKKVLCFGMEIGDIRNVKLIIRKTSNDDKSEMNHQSHQNE